MSDVQQPPPPQLVKEEEEIKEIEKKVNDTLKNVLIPIGDGNYSFTISVKLTIKEIAAGGKSTRRRQKK